MTDGTSSTNAEESPPAPTVECGHDLESSAVRMTGGLVLSMLLTSLTALFAH